MRHDARFVFYRVSRYAIKHEFRVQCARLLSSLKTMCDSYHFIEHGPMIPGMRHQVLHGFVGFLNIAISGGTLLV